jgi:hypothetical protein
MATSYTYSLSNDFNNVLNQSQLQDTISALGLTAVCYSVKNDRASPDDVVIVFDSPLTDEELVLVDGVVASHTIKTNIPGDQYDAVVSADGSQNYTLISTAIAEGHSNIFVRHGVYVEPAGFNFTGVSITGESGVKCIVYLAGQPVSVHADASGGIKETAGTISISQYTKSIVGVGTSFTNLASGKYILLGTNYFEIASVEDDTNLTLVDAYVGKTITGINYIAQSMDTGTHMTNIFIVGSAVAGLYMRGQRHFFIDSIAVKSCGIGFEIVDCGDSSSRQMISESCGSTGVIINTCVSMSFSVIDGKNHPANGLQLIGNNASMVFANCELTSCGGRGLSIEGNTSDIALTNCVLKYNASDGVYMGSECDTITLTNTVMCNNGGMGGNLLGRDVKLTSGCSCENSGIGIFVGGAATSIIGVTVRENTDGIRVSADDCIVTMNHCKLNALDGLHIETGVLDTIATYNNLKDNGTANLVDHGIDSDTTGCKV